MYPTMITPVNTSEWAVQPGPGEPLEVFLWMAVVIWSAFVGGIIVVGATAVYEALKVRQANE